MVYLASLLKNAHYPSWMHIGRNIRALRKKAGLTQVELAKALSTKQQVIARYEKCIMNPEVAKLPILAKTLKVEIADLFREEPEQNATKVKIRRANSREVRAQEAFRRLKAEEQRVIISHMNALLRYKEKKQRQNDEN